MSIRAAIIGSSFAKAAYLPALKTIADVDLIAISSGHLANAQAVATQFGIPAAYDDWQKMLDEHPVDLVCVVTPTIYHAPMTLVALERGAHVICEKPMAMNADESRQMLDKAESLKRVHLVGHELRFNPNRQKIKQIITDGTLGTIRHVHSVNVSASWGDPASRALGDWWSDAGMGGGRLGANGSHQIDLLRFWLGDIGAISGQVLTMVPDRLDKTTGAAWTATGDDFVSFNTEMRSGALATVTISSIARHAAGNSVQVYGSEGTLRLSDSDEKLMLARAGEDFVDISVYDPNADLPGINKGIWNVSFVGLMQEAIAAIREGRSVRQGATFADGLKCQQAMDALRRSSVERRWITLE